MFFTSDGSMKKKEFLRFDPVLLSPCDKRLNYLPNAVVYNRMGNWGTEMFNIYEIFIGGWIVFLGSIMFALRCSIITLYHCKHIQCFLRDDYWRMKAGAGIVFCWRGVGSILHTGGFFKKYLFRLVRLHIIVFCILNCFCTCLPITR